MTIKVLLGGFGIGLYKGKCYGDTAKDTVGDTIIFENNYLETLINYLETINVLT